MKLTTHQVVTLSLEQLALVAGGGSESDASTVVDSTSGPYPVAKSDGPYPVAKADGPYPVA